MCVPRKPVVFCQGSLAEELIVAIVLAFAGLFYISCSSITCEIPRFTKDGVPE